MSSSLLHYEDTSSPRRLGQAATWCGESVPPSQATSLRRLVTCPACRIAMGLPSAPDETPAAPEPAPLAEVAAAAGGTLVRVDRPREFRSAAYRRKTLAWARQVINTSLPELNPLAYRFACEVIEQYDDVGRSATAVFEMCEAVVSIRGATAELQALPWWAWRRRRALLARIAELVAGQVGEPPGPGFRERVLAAALSARQGLLS